MFTYKFDIEMLRVRIVVRRERTYLQGAHAPLVGRVAAKVVVLLDRRGRHEHREPAADRHQHPQQARGAGGRHGRPRFRLSVPASGPAGSPPSLLEPPWGAGLQTHTRARARALCLSLSLSLPLSLSLSLSGAVIDGSGKRNLAAGLLQCTWRHGGQWMRNMMHEARPRITGRFLRLYQYIIRASSSARAPPIPSRRPRGGLIMSRFSCSTCWRRWRADRDARSPPAGPAPAPGDLERESDLKTCSWHDGAAHHLSLARAGGRPAATRERSQLGLGVTSDAHC